jgi:xanthine dehydrogenase accessory factor
MKVELVTQRLREQGAVLVTVTRTAGSAPREAGAWMLVFAGDAIGTVGGGHLEFEAIAHARTMLQGGGASALRRFTLGPSLGQCCGGTVELSFERVDARDVDRLHRTLHASAAPLALFGGGHVGRALVHALAPLPFDITWIDSRDEVFPQDVPEGVACEHSDPVQGAVPQLAHGSRVLVMSFSHAEDLEIIAACLARIREKGDANDLPYVGLIGSATKWATFRHRLEARGFSAAELARITCPIGLPGIRVKQPAVIAASVVAQILQVAPPPA